MMKRLALALLLAGLGALGCGNGQQSTLGPSQPFRVRGAQFMSGALPGDPPPDGGRPMAEEGGPPLVTAADLNSSVAIQGQAGKGVSGRATANSRSVGIALDDVSSGYWVVPTRILDLVTGELTWSATLDFDRSIPPGLHPLRFVAFDENGNPGTQITSKFCIAGLVPDNLSACEPSVAPPAAVISLSWDANADLDLQVVTPEGIVVTPKHPSTLPPAGDAGADAAAPSGALGTIDRDSNANCVVDGVRVENLVFQKDAPEGTYQIFANLFDSCKQPSVRFDVAVYGAEPSADTEGGKELRLYYHRGGELLDSQVNPTADRGLFVTEFLFVQQGD
jgi:hypothetical protein